MAVSATAYGKAVLALGAAQFAFATDTFKVVLLTSTYSPNVDSHEFLTDLVLASNELSGTNYTAGGQALTGATWVYEVDTTVTPNVKRAAFNANAALWTNTTFTGARYAVVFKDTGTPATSRLLGYVDFGGAFNTAAEDFQVSFANSVLRLQLA